MKLLDLLYISAVDTFIQVGTFVAVTLIVFGYINYKTQGKLINAFEKHKKWQVLFGALLGLTPGCGGAILVMPLFLKGQVTFGTVMATLIATMGDAAFVILVSMPNEYLIMSIISFITALIVGYTIDYFGFFKNLRPVPATDEMLEQSDPMFQKEQTEFDDTHISCPGCNNTGFIKISPRFQKSLYYFRHHIGYIIIWILSILAFPLGIMNLMQIDFNTAFPIKNLGIIGFIGTMFSIIYSFVSKKFIADDYLPETKSKLSSLQEMLVHNAEETAFVVLWVFVALFVYNSSVVLMGGEEVMAQFMQQTGYMAVLVALLIGLLPGCGPHIVLATLYVNGLIPFSAMLANGICNDGDALFPLLAMDKKSAFVSSLVGMVPAFIVGTVAYIIEFYVL